MSPLIALLLLTPAEPKYTMRLNLHKGQQFSYKLMIESERLKTKCEMLNKVTITRADDHSLTMDIKIAGIKINGKDRTAELRKMLSDDTATMGWDRLSRRAGETGGLGIAAENPYLTPHIAEAGIYLCYFQDNAVSPGETWYGMTTATGGCTGGNFAFRSVAHEKGKQIAKFEVSKISMSGSKLVAPMRMNVDLATGLPTYVDYTVTRNASGKKVHIRQTLEI